jgi:uncharacterized protein (TIGR02680 family)
MLPEPTSERFKPLRSGLINLYKFEDQEFWFECGRLLLRGNNGTGKSRVLALQLPFLFDGEISPHRVEPDGDPAKALAWHLLMNEYDDRIGYTWIEFGRKPATGGEVFVTLGCGMRAIRGVDGLPNRWYFVTDQRIGRDFCLLTETRQPLSRDQLGAILGDTALFRTAQDYRREVDARLFGLKTRYDSLIELLIRLRAPQLARKLDENRLSSALSDALPPLDESLVEDLAESFRNLDSLRYDLDNHRQVHREVGEFMKDYRRYLQTAARRRAEAVRSHHSRYEDTNREIAEKTRNKETATANIAAAEQAKRSAELAATDASSHLEALRDSPFQRDAAALDSARGQAEQCKEQFTRDAEASFSRKQRIEEANLECENRQAQCERLLSELMRLLKSMHQSAVAVSFASEHQDHLPPISTWPTKPGWLAEVEDALRRNAQLRDESIAHLIRLHNNCLASLRELEHAQTQETGAEQRVIAERLTERQQDDLLRSLCEQLAVDYSTWMASLTWLQPVESVEVIESASRWIETGQDLDRRLPTILEQAASAAEGDRRRQLARAEQAMEELAKQISVLESERNELEAGRHVPPAATATRDPEIRKQNKGAPVWQVCDFRDTIGDGDRAYLEAALESAGLLDALITPEGALLPTAACDTFLTSETIVPRTATLLLWLRPSLSAHDVPATLSTSAIESALKNVGAGSGNGQHWVDLDGSWQLGPARGCGRKPAAEHLGEGARESVRRRRLSELADEISVLSTKKEECESRWNEIAVVRAEAIRSERLGAPNDDVIAKTLALRGAVRERLANARREYEAVQSITIDARHKHQLALAEREQSAVDLGLAHWQEQPETLRERWREYVLHLERLWPTVHHWDDARQQVERATENVDRAREDALSAETRRREAESKSVEADARYNTLQSSVGADVAKLHSETSGAKTRLKQAQDESEAAANALLEARTAAGVAEEQLLGLNTRLAETVRERGTAIEKVRLLAQHGLFSDVHASFGEFESAADTWSVTRAVEISREIDRTLRDVPLDDSAWRSRQTAVLQLFNELQTSLGAHGHQPQIEYADDSLVAVACPFHGRPLRLGQLHTAVAAEIATQERLLTEREREVIDNHLIGEVATTLQGLIRDAETKVADMNGEIERCSTSTGLTMRLKWEPLTEGIPEGLSDARRLLLADSELWAPAERTQIGQFLHGLIQDARTANPSGVWTDHLRQALDYRAWHRFVIERRQNDRWEKLTKRRYGTGSGGEKALMLTVPQMAAAAAHYRSAAAHAPRLILLDEVFVGIDSRVRAKCMGLLEAFDLDFMMTSEREWGAYPTVKGLAIYQMITHPGIDAIGTTRWVWNGRQKILAAPAMSQSLLQGSEETQDAGRP